MGAQASTAAGALDRLKDAACHRGPASKRARTLGNAGERKIIYTARFYDETVRLSNYAGPEFVPRDGTAVFLDWDDTLFPTNWVQIQQRSAKAAGRPCHFHDDPSCKALCSELIAFLCTVSRIGHVFIVTASTHGFIKKCCRICFPKLLPVLDALNVTVLYSRPQNCEAEWDETVEMWKEAAYRTLLHGPFIRPLKPALSRFYNSKGWSHVLSYGDTWSDHTSLVSAAAAVSPESIHACLKARPSHLALSAEALSKELIIAGRLLRELAHVEMDCSYDLDDAQLRVLVEDCDSLRAPAATIEALNGFSHGFPLAEFKDNPIIPQFKTRGSNSSTSTPTTSTSTPGPPTIAESLSSRETDQSLFERV
jgi:hypothetical protein